MTRATDTNSLGESSPTEEEIQAYCDYETKTPKWRRWWNWRIRGMDYCFRCRKPTHWGFYKHVVLFEDEPPMFVEQWCMDCGLNTGIHMSTIMQKAFDNLPPQMKQRLMEKANGEARQDQ